MQVVSPLDPKEGYRYLEPMRDDIENEEIENIYSITWHKEYYVNPTTYGDISLCNICSFDIDSKEDMEGCRDNLYEFSSRRCTRIIKSPHWLGMELCVPS